MSMKASGVKLGGVFRFECFDKDGNKKWEDESHNLSVNAGLQHILDILFASGTQVATWYLGLTDGSPTPAAADTLASHAGWTEFDEYTEGARQEYVDVRSGQSVSNAAAKASFAINASGTVGGGFLCSASTGTSGTLLCCAALSGGNRTVASGDTVEVTYTYTAADAG